MLPSQAVRMAILGPPTWCLQGGECFSSHVFQANYKDVTLTSAQCCEAADPLEDPKTRKNQKWAKNRSNEGFLEIRKLGQK